MNIKKLIALVCCAFYPLALQAAPGDPISLETMIIDVPTAETFDRYQASFLTRAYDHGTLMESIDFGVFPRINIGVSIAAHELVGSSNDVRVLDPDFQVKWKVYDGNLYLPAIAIGYDGRRYGYGYNDQRIYTDSKDYLDDRKGGYVTFSREIIVPGLNATAGLNLSDWEDLYWFTGMYYTLADKVSFLAEWDNIRNVRDSRLNIGMRFYLHPSLALDGAVRRIGRGDESERILQIRYVTNF
ncbi:hypothetical protein [Candidatus Avelusimicrobium gallicola]|uniref:Uncharacterized protein n=1 Tax=Candidatus Avelusimicrobium gallicola TaxID=2562704 RepID=A0A1Y4DLD1_9BACT|nr:hypothetical protein [Elusimicrobium sp. An273]OUO56221.1 hypothetical protein B5F75_06275 [Elusimicrobium sp. An273]